MISAPHSISEGATQRLVLFFGVLFVLVVTSSLLTWTMNIDILSLGPVYMFTPLIAAMTVCYFHNIPLRDVGLRLGRRRWIVFSAVVWPPVALVIAGVSTLVPGVWFDPSLIPAETGVPNDPIWMLLGLIALVAVMIVIGATINTVLAFGEEFGWRGYLLWELAPLGFWNASFLIGLVWGLWHAPLVVAGLNYPTFPILGVFVFTLVCIVVSPIYTYLVVRSGSVIPAAVFHGVFNATGLVALAETDSNILRELVASEGGVAGLTVFLFVLLGIWWLDPPLDDTTVVLASKRDVK